MRTAQNAQRTLCLYRDFPAVYGRDEMRPREVTDLLQVTASKWWSREQSPDVADLRAHFLNSQAPDLAPGLQPQGDQGQGRGEVMVTPGRRRLRQRGDVQVPGPQLMAGGAEPTGAPGSDSIPSTTKSTLRTSLEHLGCKRKDSKPASLLVTSH